MARRTNKSLLEWLDDYPPFMCYYALARRPRPTMNQFCAAAKLSASTAYRIARKLSWDSIPAKKIESFTGACGVNLLDMRRQREYLRQTWESKRRFAHLSDSELRTFNLLCARWLALRERRHREKC